MTRYFTGNRRTLLIAALAIVITGFVLVRPVQAQVTAFKQAVAEAAADDADIAEFYRNTSYAPIWTAADDASRARRAELMRAIQSAASHGLPVARYDPAALLARLSSVRSPRDRGLAEVEMSKVFLTYARDIQTGVLNPKRIDSRIVREIPYRDRGAYLSGIAISKPAAFFRALPPRSMEYNALLKEKVVMEKLLAQGGWGPQVAASKLERGATGPAVIALRNRLIAMDYLERNNGRTFDQAMTDAVKQFQIDHGLNDDGVVGGETLKQINVDVETRLQSVLVALERERWFNTERGKRHRSLRQSRMK